MAQLKFINGDLTIKRKPANSIPFKIRPYDHIIRAAALLLDGPVENNGVQVAEIERTPVDGVPRAEDDGFEQSKIKFLTDVHTHLVKGHEFFGVPAIT